MKARPILFSGPMVRALLAGSKTQTRRALTINNSTVLGSRWGRNSPWAGLDFTGAVPRTQSTIMRYIAGSDAPHDVHLDVPFVHPEDAARGMEPDGVVYRVRPQWEAGDLLWVRESWCAAGTPSCFAFMADHPLGADPRGLGWKPSIHMPRVASRLTLEITDVRVERLQDITAEDADAECFGGDYPDKVLPEVFPHREDGWGHLSIPECYGRLWEHINGPGSWAANPWVWAVSFKVRRQNIDAFLEAGEVAR